MLDFIPNKMSSSNYNLPWVDGPIRRAIRRKQRLNNKAKRTGKPEAWDTFKTLRRTTDRNIRRAYKRYVSEVIGDSLSSKNTKPFWNFVKSKRQEAFGVGTLTSDGHVRYIRSHNFYDYYNKRLDYIDRLCTYRSVTSRVNSQPLNSSAR